MRKIALGLAVLVGLVCVEALGFTPEEIKKNNLEKECKNGKSFYCNLLGVEYHLGTDFSQDYQKALFYFKKVCKKGNEKDDMFARACTNIGNLYMNEHGAGNVQQDYKKALQFYTLACNNGNNMEPEACRKIGEMYLDGEGVSQDIAKGVRYFEKACDGKDTKTCNDLAQYYYDHGDRSKAAQYFKKTCKFKPQHGAIVLREYEEMYQKACDMYERLK